MLRQRIPLESRGTVPLKGKSKPVEVLAPVPVAEPADVP
jgi:hypothetical protein